MQKSEKLWQAINTVFRFEVSQGHLKWKITDIARTSKIGRTLIYYYLGKTKAQIFENCLDMVANEFYGLSEERMALVRSGKILKCVNKTQEMFQNNPEFMIFYFRWRMKKSPIQDKLIAIEERYQNKLAEIYPNLKKEELVALHAVVQGLVCSPFVTPHIFNKTLARFDSAFCQQ